MAGVRPVDARERITSLDVLRGVALLGILSMNIQDFAMPGQAYWNPTDYGDLHGANFWVWAVTHTLADMKFMAIFGMLFGAGIVLMSSRAPAWIHYRRMGWLTLFGLLHAHLLWPGDILFTYGVCGMAVYPFRNRAPRTLILLGLAVISVAPAIGVYFGHQSWSWPPEVVKSVSHDFWQSTPASVAEHLATMRGGWRTQMGARVGESIGVETVFLVFWLFWRAAGLMLLGMALYKMGVFSGKRAVADYWRMIAVTVLVGVPVTIYGTYKDFAAGWDFRYSFFYGMQINYYASLLVSLGWIGATMLAARAAKLTRLAAVGRMAFSNYILQTVICTFIFYGEGLGLIGKVERTGQFGIVVAVWVVQLVVSPIWLRHFRFGPLEWLWRSLTYRRWEEMRAAAT